MHNEWFFFLMVMFSRYLQRYISIFSLSQVTYISYSSVYPCFTYFYCWSQNSFQILHYVSYNKSIKNKCNIQYYISSQRWDLVEVFRFTHRDFNSFLENLQFLQLKYFSEIYTMKSLGMKDHRLTVVIIRYQWKFDFLLCQNLEIKNVFVPY